MFQRTHQHNQSVFAESSRASFTASSTMAEKYPIFTPQRNAKRTKSEISPSPMNDDQMKIILKAIEASGDEMKKSHDVMRKSCDDLIEKVEKLEKSFETKVVHVENSYCEVSNILKHHDASIEVLRRQMNDIEQSKIENHMVISGIPAVELNEKMNVTSVATSSIKKYVKDFENSSIKHAFIQTTRNKETAFVVVVFKDLDSKQEVIKKKKETAKNEESNSIYFNDRLTSVTRALYQKARRIVKDIGAKYATVSHGKVTIVMNDGSRKKIRWFDDLAQLSDPQKNPQIETDEASGTS